MRRRELTSTLLLISLLGLVAACIGWLVVQPDQHLGPAAFRAARTDQTRVADAVRIGLIPERDIFDQRRRYQALCEHLSTQLGKPVEIVTLNTYHAVLDNLTEGQIDGAFVGSLLAVLAHDRLGARIVAKTIEPDNVCCYRGVVIVRSDSPVQSLDELAGRSIAMVRTTMAGNLYPVYLLTQRGMMAGTSPVRIRWVGTHDDVIREVAEGRVDAGAVKDTRFMAFEKSEPTSALRRLATSDPVPNGTFVLRNQLDPALAQRVAAVFLNMHNSDAGRQALAPLGVDHFEACSIDEFAPIYRMIQTLGPAWDQVGIEGPPPKPTPPEPRTPNPEP